MSPLSLLEVRWLTLKEIADKWAIERQETPAIILRELQLAVLNIPRLQQGEGLIPELPLESELPSPDTPVCRDWLEQFGEKNRWQLPRFWFGDGPSGRPRGRPSYRHWNDIEQEMRRRIQTGDASESWKVESNHLSSWAAEEFSRESPPAAKSIRNNLGSLRRHLLNAKN